LWEKQLNLESTEKALDSETGQQTSTFDDDNDDIVWETENLILLKQWQ
jgi:hypothetical protein